MHAKVLLYPTDCDTKGRTSRKLHKMVGNSTKFVAKRAFFADSNKILLPLVVLSERKVSMKIFLNTFAATCGHTGDVCPKKWSSLDKRNDIKKDWFKRFFRLIHAGAVVKFPRSQNILHTFKILLPLAVEKKSVFVYNSETISQYFCRWRRSRLQWRIKNEAL